jgi:hypothetical protein
LAISFPYPARDFRLVASVVSLDSGTLISIAHAVVCSMTTTLRPDNVKF